MPYCHAYLSRATRAFDTADLNQLALQSDFANSAEQISGVLIKYADAFFQVLEGDEARVRALLERIERDPRHDQVVCVFAAELPERLFRQWSMRAFNLDEISGVDTSDLRRHLRAFIGGVTTPAEEVRAMLAAFSLAVADLSDGAGERRPGAGPRPPRRTSVP